MDSSLLSFVEVSVEETERFAMVCFSPKRSSQLLSVKGPTPVLSNFWRFGKESYAKETEVRLKFEPFARQANRESPFQVENWLQTAMHGRLFVAEQNASWDNTTLVSPLQHGDEG